MAQLTIGSTEIGALSNAIRPLFKIPSGYGGITFVSAYYTNPGTGTSWLTLADLGTAGTAVSTTIASGGTAVSAAGVPAALTITAANAFVDEGHWVGVKENNIGATNTVSTISYAYEQGK